MPFATMSKKILCKDLSPLFPLESTPNQVAPHIAASVSYHKVLIIDCCFFLCPHIGFVSSLPFPPRLPRKTEKRKYSGLLPLKNVKYAWIINDKYFGKDMK